MKRIPKKPFAAILFAVLAFGTATGSANDRIARPDASPTPKTSASMDAHGIQPFDPLTPILEQIDRALFPYERIQTSPESCENPKLSPNRFLFWRISYSKLYDSEPIAQPEEGKAIIPTFSPDELPKERNHATILLVPADAFPIENAIVLRKPEELDAEDMRPFYFSKFGFQWRKIASQYEKQTLYLGRAGDFHIFADGDLSVLDRILTQLKPKGGINLPYLLASGLLVKDAYNYTCRYSIMRLAEMKDPSAVRAIRAMIRHSADLDEYPFPQFTALSLMDLPEAHQLVNEGTASENRYVRIGAATALARRAEPSPVFKEGYLNMIRTRTCLAQAVQSAIDLGFGQEILPLLETILRTPHNAEEYTLVAQAVWAIRNPQKIPPHGLAAENIRIMLMRSGDLVGTARYQSVDAKDENARQIELAKLDRERIKPYYDFLASSPDTDLSIIAAIDLALFKTHDKRLAQVHAADYLKRVNEAGVRLLCDLPREKTIPVLQAMIRNNESEQEKTRLSEILRAVRIGGSRR